MDLVSQSCFSSDRDFSVFSTRSRLFMHLIAFSLAFSFLISLVDAHTIRKKQIWMKKELFWAFRDPFDLIHSSEQKKIIRSLIETAFTLWESALDGRIVFHQKELINNTVLGLKKPEGVDIDILFAKGHHGDKEDLDGRGGMVAHSGYPPSGFLHLDSDENWSMDDTTGVDLRYVIS
uniref:Peptidase_M10 domain-containing protein n=1 Tax=Heterorhabditis bacteriophora TaxID=37862 RepID=A0A1I7X899_HETBA